MSENTKIQWCDHTHNEWRGCAKVSPGCAHCYAETMSHRFGEDCWGAGKDRILSSEATRRKPERWNKTKICTNCDRANPIDAMVCEGPGCAHFEFRRPRVFSLSRGDWLDPEVPIEWLARLMDLIRRTPNLDWLLLTKRPEQWRERLQFALSDAADLHHAELCAFVGGWLDGTPPPNVWFGVSAEDQQRWDERVPALLSIPAKVRFVSVEPMLGPIDMEEYLEDQCDGGYVLGTSINWIIFGGESGPKARPCNVEWIRDGLRQCREAGVKAFVKQLGAEPRFGEWALWPCKDRKGGDIAEFPEDLRVREWPGN